MAVGQGAWAENGLTHSHDGGPFFNGGFKVA